MIKKNLIVTVLDSVDLASGIHSEALHLRTAGPDQVVIEAMTQKVAIRLDDLQEALNAIKEFKGSLDTSLTVTENGLTPSEEALEKQLDHLDFITDYGDAEEV